MLLACATVSILLSLLVIELGRRIINLVSSRLPGTHADVRLLVIYCCAMLLTVIAGGLSNYVLTVSFARLSQSVLQDIRVKVFAHILRLPQEFHNRNPVGVIMSLIINDIGYIGQFLSRAFLVPILNTALIAFFTAYIFYLNWKLAVAAVIAVPFIVIVLPGFNRRLAALSAELSNSTGRISDYFQEAFSAIGDIRSNQTYAFEESRLKGRMREFFGINVNLAKASGALEFWMRLITQFGPFAIYLYGGYLCMRNELAVGTLIATIGAISSLYGPVDTLVSLLQEWRQVKVRFEKLDGYLRLKPESEIIPRKGACGLADGDVRFDNVRFGFNEREMLLQDISFTVSPGKRVAFVGTSGSGKSLTAALMSRIYPPLGGAIHFGKTTIDSIPLSDLRSAIGQVSQVPFLFHDSIKKNILYALLRKEGAPDDRFEDWVDFSMLPEVGNRAQLDAEVIRVVREVALFDDIYELGLRSGLSEKLRTVATDNKERIIQARRSFMHACAEAGSLHVEHYHADRFLEYCTLLENIVFCPCASITDAFGSVREFATAHLHEHLKGTGVLEKLFDIGVRLARTDSFLFERLKKSNSALLTQLGLTPGQIDATVRANEKLPPVDEMVPVRMDRVDPTVAGDILDLAYSHVAGKSKERLVGDDVKREILLARSVWRKNAAKEVRDRLRIFSQEEYMDALSLRENIVFGNIDPSRKRANETIHGLIKEIVGQVGIADLVLGNGLEFNVGERGNNLSGGQRQKVAIARILLKDPSIVILDEATASLDAGSQAVINERIRERFRDKTVISIVHRLNTIKDYDEILVFDRGQIVERGTFEELIGSGGLFKKLFEGSN